MAFHTAIWLSNYAGYVEYLSDLDSISSNVDDYGPLEYSDMHGGASSVSDALMETHNYIPGSKDDVNLWGFMAVQFDWGKKVVTFFRHPAD